MELANSHPEHVVPQKVAAEIERTELDAVMLAIVAAMPVLRLEWRPGGIAALALAFGWYLARGAVSTCVVCGSAMKLRESVSNTSDAEL